MTTEKASSRLQSPGDRNVQSVVLGDLLFKPWYQSIYPEDLVAKDAECLHVCRWCFRYSCDRVAFAEHTRECVYRTKPPGTKVYDHSGYAVWEVDGEEHKLFGQNLSLFAKLFLDHKTVFFDVATFLYYILTFTDPDNPENYHVLGFYSKEKLSWDSNNLACICVFPPYQHRQLGKLLMGAKKATIASGPSGSQDICYAANVAKAKTQSLAISPKPPKRDPPRETMTVEEVGQATGMLAEDVITAIKFMGVVQPETPRKRKTPRLSGDGGPAQVPTMLIRKEDVWKWAKVHQLSLEDPVREDGFILPSPIVSDASQRASDEE
ncbi:hypothetical protein N7526_002446 [Penicillium atrosanguineum]|nr:hypothetical protein N7526_002446 [Penicillium atrosanguineum]